MQDMISYTHNPIHKMMCKAISNDLSKWVCGFYTYDIKEGRHNITPYNMELNVFGNEKINIVPNTICRYIGNRFDGNLLFENDILLTSKGKKVILQFGKEGYGLGEYEYPRLLAGNYFTTDDIINRKLVNLLMNNSGKVYVFTDIINNAVDDIKDMFLDGDIQTQFNPFKKITQDNHEFIFKNGCKIKILRNTEEQTRGIVLDNNYMFFNYNMRFKIR